MRIEPPVLHRTELRTLRPLHRGKVRDLYDLDADTLLIVTTDRLSAFDVVLPDPIPGKGRVLNEMSNFWFARTTHIVPNHLTGRRLSTVVTDPQDLATLERRSVIVRKLRALPIEAVVRGYLAGSAWKDYSRGISPCGLQLPTGLSQAERLPNAIFTPAYKAEMGAHDENISFDRVVQLVGNEVANEMRRVSLALYEFAADHAQARGIIIADTKFEFGLDALGRLTLMDEVLTPDSSRFWPEADYQVGTSPPSFDKQFVRDYLETLDWNKTAPGPRLPSEVIRLTSAKYGEALARLTAPPALSERHSGSPS